MTEEKKEEIKEEKAKVEKAEAPKAEEKKEEVAQVEVPAKFKKIVEEIANMSVIELNELVKIFEAKFGVSAQAVAIGPAVGGTADAGEEQSLFTIELTAPGAQKIAVIKAVKSLLGLGLKEAKDAVDGAPTVLKEGVKKEEAEEIKKQIEVAGGKVTLK
jgi:large subunit ribosomal protein L7/L12